MIWVGAVLAVITGVVYNGAAAFQKREAVQVKTDAHVFGKMLQRKVWLTATAMSVIAWMGEAAAFSLAPVALVVPLLAIGSAVLVTLGVKLLHERFKRHELFGIALVAIGAATAGAAETGSSSSHHALSFTTLFIIFGIAVTAGSALLLRARSGIVFGIAAGFGFAADAIYSKEVGDSFAEHGFGAITKLLASPTPYLLVVISVAALALLQSGFQRANAASVMAGLTVPEAIGPIVASFVLYHERYPTGIGAILLPAGVAFAIAGSALLAFGRSPGVHSAPEPTIQSLTS
ncbi:MAG: hypothetical protein NVSMB57_16770 [Actinomycetota bacterium]